MRRSIAKVLNHRSSDCCKMRRHRGIALIWTAMFFIVLIGFAGLAIDTGYVFVTGQELQTAADSAALAGAASVKISPAQAQIDAVNSAASNRAAGAAVQLNAAGGDVVVGNYNRKTAAFTANGSPSNAVKVTARRTQGSPGGPVSLFFGPIFNITTSNVSRTAIAISNASLYGVIGLNSITFNGQGISDSYDASVGPYSAATAGSHGSMASNGKIQFTGNSFIHGDARPGIGKTVSTQGDTITGSTAPLTKALTSAPASAGIYATSNNNNKIPAANLVAGKFSLGAGKSLSLPGGNYYVSGFTTASGSTLTFTGPVNLYVNGNTVINGAVTTYSNLPSNFSIQVVAPSTSVTLGLTGKIYASIYAPQSSLSIGGNNTLDVYGRIVGLSLLTNGNANFHIDQSSTFPGSPGRVALVN